LADQNDLQLYRLGHADDLNCTRCDGQPGDTREPGTIDAQVRFHMLTSSIGLAFVPQFQEPAGTLGQAGFEIGIGSRQAFLRIPADAWAGSGPVPRVLVLPEVTLRKGLGGSLELGIAGSWLSRSQMFALSAELRWAMLDGLASAPDVALRAFGTRLLGAREIDLTVAGADLSASKSFAIAGMMRLQPYGQFGVVLINAATPVIDFKPQVENDANPTADDATFRTISMLHNRYLRGAAGVRLVSGVFVVGVEGSFAAGSNPVQDDPLPASQCSAGSCAPPDQTVRLWTLAGRLGLAF
jgi:hypothetical protein